MRKLNFKERAALVALKLDRWTDKPTLKRLAKRKNPPVATTDTGFILTEAGKAVLAGPYPPVHPTETMTLFNHLTWDVTLAWYMVDSDRPLYQIDVAKDGRNLIPLHHIEPENLDLADENIPLLLFKFNTADLGFGEGRELVLLLDGTHRLRKALDSKLPTVNAYIFDIEEARILRYWKQS